MARKKEAQVYYYDVAPTTIEQYCLANMWSPVLTLVAVLLWLTDGPMTLTEAIYVFHSMLSYVTAAVIFKEFTALNLKLEFFSKKLLLWLSVQAACFIVWNYLYLDSEWFLYFAFKTNAIIWVPTTAFILLYHAF
jgi:hypothetical protein